MLKSLGAFESLDYKDPGVIAHLSLSLVLFAMLEIVWASMMLSDCWNQGRLCFPISQQLGGGKIVSTLEVNGKEEVPEGVIVSSCECIHFSSH